MNRFIAISLFLLVAIILGYWLTLKPTATVNVSPFNIDNVGPDQLYCEYEIVNVKGKGEHKVGDNLCVLCGYDGCESERIIIPAEGVEYFVKNTGVIVTCRSCEGVEFYKNKE